MRLLTHGPSFYAAPIRSFAYHLRRKLRRPLPGGFQPYSHTLPDRYPWLFRFAAEAVADGSDVRLLSFGCSQGDEVFALRKYFPRAYIKGIDIRRRNIARCRRRARKAALEAMFTVGASTQDEETESYDAIFCLSVLCHGDLANMRPERCDPLLRFEDFQRIVADFARCLKPGGLLLLYTTSFRFCDTEAARDFDAVLDVGPDRLAADVLFDRDNRLMKGEQYRSVAFRKRAVSYPTPA